ncbi:MAG TPA: hypothetical protein VIT64_10865, partial [Ilumatobacteraceae bacterium]
MKLTPSSDQRRWAWLDWVVRVGSPEASISRPQPVPLASLGRPASFLSTAIPLTMVIVGLALAVPSAVWAERPSSEGLGTFGVEAGAALWFGGAVALSVRRTTTVRRGLVVVLTGVVGSALIVLALAFGW